MISVVISKLQSFVSWSPFRV